MRRHVADKRFARVRFDPKQLPEWKDLDFADYVGMAVWYCQEVLAGHVPACEYEQLACRRFLMMKAQADAGTAPYIWSDADVCDVCFFIENLPHTKAFKGYIVLEPVQCFYLAAIFGFREKQTGLRWVRSVSLWIPRKNAKTTLSVGISLYCLTCEGEEGAELTISAGSEKQAHIPFDAMRDTIKKDEDLSDFYRAKHTAEYIELRSVGAKVTLATAKAENLDGYNPHIVLAEELHAQSQKVIGVLRTAMGSRSNPLFVTISTAGRDTNAPAHDDWTSNIAVLEGRMRNDRLFCVVYAGSKEDEERKFDIRVIEKLNPLFGVSLNPTSIQEEIFEAQKSESKLNEYKRTRLNIWSRAAGNLLSVENWNACADVTLSLDAFKGFPIYVGIDLASRSDLNAVVYLTKVDETVYMVGRYWLPRNAERMKNDQFADQFLAWAAEGALTLTDLHEGTYIDADVILADVLETLEGHNVVGVAIDDHQGNLLASAIERKGYTTYFVRKNAKSLTPSTEDIIGRTQTPSLFQHDGNPVSAWCAGNVVGYFDQNSNVLPKKEKPNSKANIDGIDALILANAIRLDNEAGTLGTDPRSRPETNPYLHRGLAGFAA